MIMVMRYNEYFELSEKHSWRTIELPWDDLRRDVDKGLVSDFDRAALVGTAVIEHGVPHYGEVWTLVPELRDNWELWQFTTLWTGEEGRHSFALQKACDLLGLSQAEEDFAQVRTFQFAETQKKSCPTDCYRTVPGMLAYTTIQELATNKFYSLAAKKTDSPFLKRLFTLIGGDEMRHHVFYRDALASHHKTARDKAEYSDQVFKATRAFKMPHLVYDIQMKFFEHGDWSIGMLGKMTFKAQLARCFAFDARLLGRLMTEGAEDTLMASGGRQPVLQQLG